jgi:hypothetical protein
MLKTKLINDPVWGFIHIKFPIILKIIDHRFFQRLRRIKQLGMTDMVYPGANHTRFAHALGAYHLMSQSLEVLKGKGILITKEEEEAVLCGILLHDIGHGPFSHTLEFLIIKDVHHENLSLQIMERLNEEFDGALSLAIAIFLDKYEKPFLHQLISSQLDMDRLDYLSRDSFYTGVSEGVIGVERLIHMLNVANSQLVIEQKGIYSIEKFLIARRLMYWQVYLHKTVVIGDCMLQKLLERTSFLLKKQKLNIELPLHPFLLHTSKKMEIEDFLKLDDTDVYSVIKNGVESEDRILSTLCKQFIHRRLWHIQVTKNPIESAEVADRIKNISSNFKVDEEDAKYFYTFGSLENKAYIQKNEQINILTKSGDIVDVTELSDNYNLDALKETVIKNYFTWSD